MTLVVLAPRCAVCRSVLQRAWGGPVCGACWGSVRLFTPPTCSACGGPLGWSGDDRCDACRDTPRAVDRGAAAGPYEGTLRDIVHALKYQGRRSVAGPLAALMVAQAGDLLAGVEVAVPVPLHWHRRHARGFNQAEDLARHLGLPVCRALVRCRATPSQIGLSADERRRNVRGAFRLAGATTRRRLQRQGRVKGRIVVIVDDVTTTGATIDACAAVLRAAGAREVRALTAARTVSTPAR